MHNFLLLHFWLFNLNYYIAEKRSAPKLNSIKLVIAMLVNWHISTSSLRRIARALSESYPRKPRLSES